MKKKIIILTIFSLFIVAVPLSILAYFSYAPSSDDDFDFNLTASIASEKGQKQNLKVKAVLCNKRFSFKNAYFGNDKISILIQEDKDIYRDFITTEPAFSYKIRPLEHIEKTTCFDINIYKNYKHWQCLWLSE